MVAGCSSVWFLTLLPHPTSVKIQSLANSSAALELRRNGRPLKTTSTHSCLLRTARVPSCPRDFAVETKSSKTTAQLSLVTVNSELIQGMCRFHTCVLGSFNKLADTNTLPASTALMAENRSRLRRDFTTYAEPPAPIAAFI